LAPPSRRGAVADPDLRERLGRGLRLHLQHAGGARQGTPPGAGEAGCAAWPDRPRPGLPARRPAPSGGRGGPMSLVTRVSVAFLVALALVLGGLSACLFYLDWR